MNIRNSAKGKSLEINISSNNGHIELWINDELSYLTPGELVEIYKMVQRAGRDLFSD